MFYRKQETTTSFAKPVSQNPKPQFPFIDALTSPRPPSVKTLPFFEFHPGSYSQFFKLWLNNKRWMETMRMQIFSPQQHANIVCKAPLNTETHTASF